MPQYSKYMLRKWEARVPLPPQPEGPKPTSPTSHESAPAEAGGYLGRRSLLHPCFETATLCSQECRTREGEQGGSVCLMPKPHSEAVTREWRARGCLLTAPAVVIPRGLHADCGPWHPNSSSLLVTLGKAFIQGAQHPCP